jgi:hypothetical protein
MVSVQVVFLHAQQGTKCLSRLGHTYHRYRPSNLPEKSQTGTLLLQKRPAQKRIPALHASNLKVEKFL